MSLNEYFKGKKVLVTGNTGFKGVWLSLYLHHLGAKVIGLSNNPDQENNTFRIFRDDLVLDQYYAEIEDFEAVNDVIHRSKPDIIFHLAAQAITLAAFDNPLKTFHVNGIGTANVLESLRQCDFKSNAVIVTSDKCYRNNEWIWGYRENDILMGTDPYSASKSVAEIIFNSYFLSYFSSGSQIKVCSCRAGNVIGGGDWNPFRIIPDCIRAWVEQKPIIIRNPESIRPWNYILDVIYGYLLTAFHMDNGEINGQAFNFGPNSESEISVLKLVQTLWEYWDDQSFQPYEVSEERAQYFEHRYLKLNSDKAKSILKWKPLTSIRESLDATSEWHKLFRDEPTAVYDFSRKMIENYKLQIP